jgi:hypothetical protein
VHGSRCAGAVAHQAKPGRRQGWAEGSALSLVINALTVWNTRYLQAAAEELARRGGPIPEDAWTHLTPLLWEHIHLVGHYRFEEPVITGELRPLPMEEIARARPAQQATAPAPTSSDPKRCSARLARLSAGSTP